MAEVDDRIFWQYAKDNDLIVVTQDADFDALAQLHGFPPRSSGCGAGPRKSLIEAACWKKSGDKSDRTVKR